MKRFVVVFSLPDPVAALREAFRRLFAGWRWDTLPKAEAVELLVGAPVAVSETTATVTTVTTTTILDSKGLT